MSFGPWLPSQLSLNDPSSKSDTPLLLARCASMSFWSEPPDLDGVRTDRTMNPGGNCMPALCDWLFDDAPLCLGVVWEDDDGGEAWEEILPGVVPFPTECLEVAL